MAVAQIAMDLVSRHKNMDLSLSWFADLTRSRSVNSNCALRHRLLWTSPSFFEVAEYHFYEGLAHAAQYEAASNDKRPMHLEALASHHKQLEA